MLKFSSNKNGDYNNEMSLFCSFILANIKNNGNKLKFKKIEKISQSIVIKRK